MKLDVKKYIFLLILFKIGVSHAQNIHLISTHSGDEIKLRWTPDSMEVWEDGNRFGYRLIRYTYERDSGRLNQEEAKFIYISPLQPKPYAFFKQLAQKGDNYAELAGQLLYNQEKATSAEEAAEAQAYRYVFSLFSADMSWQVAQAMALGYSDRSVMPNEKYRYEVAIAYPDERKQKTSLTTDLNARIIENIIQEVSASYQDSVVTLRFNLGGNLAFAVERSDDGGITYQKVTESPVLATYDEGDPKNDKVLYANRVPTLYKNYYFRVRAYTQFESLSAPSEPVKVYAYVTSLPEPQKISHILNKKLEVLLGWDYPDSLLSNIQGFKIGYLKGFGDSTVSYLTPKLLGKNERRFFHKPTQNEGFYVVIAVDLQGREITSTPYLVQIEDTTPPLPPENFKGKVSKEGIVSLTWSYNKEYDLYGYQIYRSSKKESGYDIVAKEILTDSVYNDTLALRLLHKYEYYIIAALDNHLNKSVFRDTVVIKRPDIIPPVAPAITDFEVKNESISLVWINSISEDVVRHVVYRRNLPNTTLNTLVTFDQLEDKTSFTDSTVEEGMIYEYVIQAYDDADLVSAIEDCSIKLQITPPHYRQPITGVKVSYSKKEKVALLTWNYRHPKLIVKEFQLFRLDEGDILRPYKKLNSTDVSFKDAKVKEGHRHAYALVAYLSDGSETLPSDYVFVDIPTASKKDKRK